MSRILIAFAVSAVTLCSVQISAADSIYTLRASAYLSPLSHTVTRIFAPWIEDVERESNGRIRFETYWGGGLGRNPYKQFDLVKAGVSDVTLVQPSYTPGQFPETQILELPFLTRTSSEASVLAWQLYERGLLSGYEEVKLIGIWTAEPGNLYTRTPITNYNDISGMKIRAAGRLEGDFVKRLGAVPESMHPADAVEALRRGTIDGTIQGWVSVNTFQTYRHTSHVITSPLSAVSFTIMMNKETWNTLPRDLQAIIENAGGLKVALRGGRSYDRRVVEIARRLPDEGHLEPVAPDPEEFERMREFLQPVADDWIERTEGGEKTFSAAQEILTGLRRRERQM
ncbi:MAG: TRAP transporter substrate-binding protein [Rhodospirillaceae bacterium]